MAGGVGVEELLALGLAALALGSAVVHVASALELVRTAVRLRCLASGALRLALLALTHVFSVLFVE